MTVPAQRNSTTAVDSVPPDPIEVLAQQAALGEPAALGELYERYVDPLFRWAQVKVFDYPTAEDVCAETWMRVTRAIQGYKTAGPGTFARWLWTIARNIVLDLFKSAPRRREVLTEDMVAGFDAPGSDDPHVHAEAAEARGALVRAVGKLPARMRECVTYRFFHGLTVAETAQVMGISAGAVRQFQFKAINALRTTVPAAAVTPIGFAMAAVESGTATVPA